MSERKAKLKLPDTVAQALRVPLVAFVGSDNDERDTSQPLAVDKDGNPLYYAPRGIVFRIPWH